MRVGKMRVGKMRAGEMRVGEMSLTHTVTQAVVCSKTRFVSLLSVCKREPCHNCRKQLVIATIILIVQPKQLLWLTVG